jgi:site-specific DNA recombinase
MISQAHVWFDQLTSGESETVREISKKEKLHGCDVSRALRLAFLAPDIVEAIISGAHPVDLNTETLRNLETMPLEWKNQRLLLIG